MNPYSKQTHTKREGHAPMYIDTSKDGQDALGGRGEEREWSVYVVGGICMHV